MYLLGGLIERIQNDKGMEIKTDSWRRHSVSVAIHYTEARRTPTWDIANCPDIILCSSPMHDATGIALLSSTPQERYSRLEQ